MIINIPISKGLGATSADADWIDRIPENMLSVPKSVLEAEGYLRSFPGLERIANTSDITRGAIYNANEGRVYRVIGQFLTDNHGTRLRDIGGSGYAPMAYSQAVIQDSAGVPHNTNITAFVSAGRLHFWTGAQLFELQDWDRTAPATIEVPTIPAPGTPAPTVPPTRPVVVENPTNLLENPDFLLKVAGAIGRREVDSSQFASVPALDTIIDVVRNRGRYIWLSRASNRFGVTDLRETFKPDRIAPIYGGSSDSSHIIALGQWRDYVVTFGRNTTQFFGLTGNANQLYQGVSALTVRCGIVGQQAKCLFANGFAVLGNPIEKPVSVYLLENGQHSEIATRYIQKQLDNYTESELRSAILEPVKFRAHNLLLVKLSRQTFAYDLATENWSELFSDAAGTMPYSGVYHVYDNDRWTATSTDRGGIYAFDHINSLQDGEQVTHVFYTQMIQVRNARLFDLEIDAVFGQEGEKINIGLSSTQDGITFSNEEWINLSMPLERTKRIIKRRIGYVKNNIGFRLRIVNDQSFTASNLRIRVEGEVYGQ